MAGSAETWLEELLAACVRFAHRRARAVALAALVVTALAAAVAGTGLGVDSDPDSLFDPDLPFQQLRAELDEAIPAQRDVVLAVIDGPSERAAEQAAAELAAAARADRDRFRGAFAPGSGPFFERHGLLYLPLPELEEVVDEIAAAQPFLAALARDPSLRGAFEQLTLAVRHEGLAGGDLELAPLLQDVERALGSALRREVRPETFGELRLAGAPGDTRRFVLVTPRVDFREIPPGRGAVDRLRELAEARGFEARGLRLRLTGDLVLQVEELATLRAQAALTGIASFLLVATILGLGLRSARLVLAAVGTLAAGLLWTAAFAALAVGRLNLISVAFAVLFIGLGVDFGIHFVLRYRELRGAGRAAEPALTGTARSVGSSIALCALTTAIGFLAFVPTGYRGVAELGVISGAGMALSLLATLTVLPALLSLGRGAAAPGAAPEGRSPLVPTFPVRAPRAVCAITLAIAGGAAVLAPRLPFDPSPLRVRDPDTEAVRTFEELLDDERLNPWSIDVLAPDLAAAERLSRRLERLPEVERATTLSDWVPDRQEEKLALIEDAALLLPLDVIEPLPPPERAETRAALADFAGAVRDLARQEGALAEAARALLPELERFRSALGGGGAREEAILAALRASLVEPVAEQVDRLGQALRAGPVTREDLPAPLREWLLAADGRARVHVAPAESLRDDAALGRFVEAVRQVAPRATGTSVTMFDTKRTIVEALREAFALALVAVALVLGLLWRSVRDAALALAPLLLAALVTAAAAVLIGLPVNFANVIVLPLLLGIGVDSGIHLVHRHRLGGHRDLLETSTSRAILWSALTTIASFGTLGLASHRGLASLGQLLTLGVAATLLANLLFLPALITLVDRRREVRRAAGAAEGNAGAADAGERPPREPSEGRGG